MKAAGLLFAGIVIASWMPRIGRAEDKPARPTETLQELVARISQEGVAAYKESRFSTLSKDYFARFSRDLDAQAEADEVTIGDGWKIAISTEAAPLGKLMAGHLVEFLEQRMAVKIAVEDLPPGALAEGGPQRAVVLLDAGGGASDVPESFTIVVERDRVTVHGRDAAGLRDGIVKLVDLMGFREAPILKTGRQVYRPRLKVRLGTFPIMGSDRDLVFLGYNATSVAGGDLYALSSSDAIPELKDRRKPGSLDAGRAAVQAARRYGLKTYASFSTRQKFPKDHAVFAAHPDIRGALTWKEDGEYVLCTEHPLVRRFLTESVASAFRAIPELDGALFIIGGEDFYHCYMRPFGTPKGHTNCKRCEPLGAETVVANLCNAVAAAIREVSPNAEALWWPYSAKLWSADLAQTGLIAKLKPGSAIFTEIEKDEYVSKPDGVRKHIWDYSIDLIGPGPRAQQQVQACRQAGIPIYMKSEPERSFEGSRLPHIPCLDRWADRAEALAACGAAGVWVVPICRPCYGTSAAEVNRFFWWDPVPDKEELLGRLARRIAGPAAAPHLREAWKHVSDAIPWSPEIPYYYTGPFYLGPAHPMCADPNAKLPEVFYGYYFFFAEITAAEGIKKRPTFVTSPTGDVPVFGKFYRKMEGLLEQAVQAIGAAEPLVDSRHHLMFDTEVSSTRWFYHTARTAANFYESCQFRDKLLKLADQPERTPAQIAEARQTYQRWREVLRDEKANAVAALPVMEADVRLNFRYGGDYSFADGADMIRAKLELLEREITALLPSLAKRCGFDPPG